MNTIGERSHHEILASREYHTDPQPKSAGTSASCFSMTMETSMPSEIKTIALCVEQIMRLIELPSCIARDESAVELGLREALNNAVIHGNATEPDQFVGVPCRCGRGKDEWLEVRDQGKGFARTLFLTLLHQTGSKPCMARAST